MEPRRRKLAEKVFENHVQLIGSFLPYADVVNLKQGKRGIMEVNRICYYNLTVFDIWQSMKWHVAEIKWQDVDLDLEEEEKPNDKNTRNIRIHSLNKRMSQEALTKNVKRPIQRFPSHAKKQDSFARTETLGFKRLGLTKNHDYLLELPDKLDLSNLAIRLNDPIGKNLERAQMASDLIDRWLDYHKKISELSEDIPSLSHWKEKQTLYEQYSKRFSKQNYQQLILNCQKLTNLDDGLKKKLKIFNEKHRIVMQNKQKIQFVRKAIQKAQVLLKELQVREGIKHLQVIEEIVQNFQQLRESASELIDNHMPAFISKIEPYIDKYLAAGDFQFSTISTSEEKQLELQVILSITDKTLKLQNMFGKPQHQIALRRWQNWRHVADRLLKMAKYFTKIRQQLKVREGKTSDTAAIQEIKKFLREYEEYSLQFQVFDERNRQILDQQMQKFKNNIDNLKTRIKDRQK